MPIEADDLSKSAKGGPAPVATIDIVLAPSKEALEPGSDVGASDEETSSPSGDAPEDEVFEETEAQLLGTPQTISDEPEVERFAWRTTIQPSAEGLGVKSESHPMTFDSNERKWVASRSDAGLTRQQSALVGASYVGESRDIDRELSARGSAIRRILSDLELDEDVRSEIEDQLAKLGTAVVDGSATIGHVADVLQDAEQVMGTLGSATVSPIPTTAEGLARTVDITLDMGRGHLPSRLHGSGSKSLVSLQVQTLLYRLRAGRDGSALLPHPLTLIEEPEAHLHPQAQLELPGLLSRFDGQVVASTHSSHFVSSVEHRCIRILRDEGSDVVPRSLAPSPRAGRIHRIQNETTHLDAVEKLKRLVERPFGELLFATAVVIGDGATERAFLPPLLRHALGSQAHGVCVIDPDSLNGPLSRAAADFARLIDIPWFVFGDDDDAGRDAVEMLKEHCSLDESRQVVMLAGSATEQMMLQHGVDICQAAIDTVRPDLGLSAQKGDLKKLKGSVGPALAAALIVAQPTYAEWPRPVVSLIELMRREFQRRSAGSSVPGDLGELL